MTPATFFRVCFVRLLHTLAYVVFLVANLPLMIFIDVLANFLSFKNLFVSIFSLKIRVFVSAMTFISVHISLSVILHVFLFAAF